MKDLHLHLSGSTPPEILWEIIRESGFKTGAKKYDDFVKTISMDRDDIKDLDSYLRVLHAIEEAQSSPLAVKECMYEAYKTSYLVGCNYLEVRWNPIKRSQKGRIDLDSLIVAARAGYERAKTIYGIEGGMILCMGRDCSETENEAVFKKALQYNSRGIIGLDLAGSERHPMSNELIKYYRAANTEKMITTCHVGETEHDGMEDEMAFVLEKLAPKRIGHGIQMVKFPKLLKKASSMNVHFEICISSNIATRAANSLDLKHTFRTLEENGITFSINTDATFPLKTNIKRENELFKEITGGTT